MDAALPVKMLARLGKMRIHFGKLHAGVRRQHHVDGHTVFDHDDGGSVPVNVTDNDRHCGQPRQLTGVFAPVASAEESAQKEQKRNAAAEGQNDGEISLRQEQQRAGYATTAGKDSGLVYDDFVKEAVTGGRARVDVNGEERVYLSAEAAERVNQVAKALGLRVQFADSVRGGTANAQISGDTILIEKDNPNPVLAIAGHEFGHRLQELAPEEYRRFRESILEGREQEVRDKAAQYAKLGVNVTYEEAMNEVANDQAGLLMDGGEVLDRFIEQHRSDRTLLQKMRDAIRSFIDKVTGKERKRLETAEGKLEAALKAAAREAKALQKKAAGDTMGAGKYSLKEDGVDGREESRTGRIDTEIVENRTGAGREFEQKGREGNSGNGGKLAVSDRRRTQRMTHLLEKDLIAHGRRVIS